MQAQREKGICYSFNEKFGPDHKCKNQKLFILEVEEEMEGPIEDGATEDEDTPTKYIHALLGYSLPNLCIFLIGSNNKWYLY